MIYVLHLIYYKTKRTNAFNNCYIFYYKSILCKQKKEKKPKNGKQGRNF